MGMENFGIDVDVKLNDDEARSSIIELANQLKSIKEIGERGITLDLGLGRVNEQKIGKMMDLVEKISRTNIKDAFEISDKSIDSLVKLREVADSIGKLSKNQISLFNSQKTKTETEGALKEYRKAQGEIRKLQTQMSKTVDSQVFTALSKQLDSKQRALQSIRDKNKEKISMFDEEDKRSALKLQQTYGKVFDSIQQGATQVAESVDKITKNSLMDTSKLDEYKAKLKEILGMTFDEVDYKGLNKAGTQLEMLKKDIFDFNKEIGKSTSLNALSEKDSFKQYKAVLNEIKTLQSQMSKTTDFQAFGSLDKQLRDYKSMLKNLRSSLTDEQLVDVSGMEKVNADKMERIYAQVFDSIQKQARKMQTTLKNLGKNSLVDVDELERVKSTLNGITNLDFGIVKDYEVFSSTLRQVEKLKESLSSLNKGASLNGFNQSKNVQEWKNLYNIITATKKEMAKTTNPVSTMAYSKSIEELNEKLKKCYSLMSSTDKKTVDAMSNFGNMNMDLFFSKSADGIIKQAQTLETSLMNIGKNSFTDTSKLDEYQRKIKEIIQTMNSGLLEGTLNEFNIPYDKKQIDGLKNAIKELGDETKRSLKIDDFVNGINTQLKSMKNKFKDALPDEEISRIQDKFNGLKNVSLDELPSAFKRINNEVQLLRANSQDLSKIFKSYTKADDGINELINQFTKLSQAEALSIDKSEDLHKRISSLSNKTGNLDLFGSGAEQEIENISREIKDISTEMKKIKVPDVLKEWEKLNNQVKTYKEQLSKAYDNSTMTKLQRDILDTEDKMESLVKRMNSMQVGDMLKISSQTEKGLQEYFRKQADGAIRELDKINGELDELFNNKFADNSGIKSLIDNISNLKRELKSSISMDSIFPTSLNSDLKNIESIKKSMSDLKKNANDLEKTASKPLKDYIEQVRKLEQAHVQLAKSQSVDMSEKWTNSIKETSAKMKQLYNELGKAEKITADKISSGLQGSLDTKLSSQIDKMYTQMSKLKDLSKDLKMKDFMDVSQLNSFDKKIDNVFNSLKNLDKVDGIGLNKISAELRSVVEESKSLSKVANFGEKISSEIEKLESSCTNSKLKSYLQEVKNELNGFMNMPVGSNGIDKQMNKIEASLRRVQTQTNRTGSFFNDLYTSMRTYTLGDMIGDSIVRSGREAINVIRELDSALVEMTRVAPADFQINTDSLKAIKDEASAIGKEVGKSSSDVIIGIGEALRVGAKSVSDAKEIARQSAIFSNVADLDQKTASETINSVLSAFGGIKNALQPVRGEVKGATDDYTNLQHAMDLINFAG